MLRHRGGVRYGVVGLNANWAEATGPLNSIHSLCGWDGSRRPARWREGVRTRSEGAGGQSDGMPEATGQQCDGKGQFGRNASSRRLSRGALRQPSRSYSCALHRLPSGWPGTTFLSYLFSLPRSIAAPAFIHLRGPPRGVRRAQRVLLRRDAAIRPSTARL